MEGKILGKATRGRKSLQMISDITSYYYYVTLKKNAKDRSSWQRSLS